MRSKCLVEFIGTFFLFLTIGIAVSSGAAQGIVAFVIGGLLIALVYAGAHLSGAHYNPAATTTLWLRGVFPRSAIPAYLLAQVAGAILAAFATRYLTGAKTLTTTSFELGPALLAEFLFTFALCWVILNTAAVASTAGNSYYGLAIGTTVGAGILAVGPISGAVFNPAVAIGLGLLGLIPWPSLWIYFVAPLAGAITAAFVFKFCNDQEGG